MIEDGVTYEAWVNGQPVIVTGPPWVETTTREINTHLSEYAADETWEFTDAAGHYHGCGRSTDAPQDRWPTLDPRYRPCDGACGDPDHRETYYVCHICEEEIEPGLRIVRGPGPRSIVTGQEWTLEFQVDPGPGWSACVGQDVNFRVRGARAQIFGVGFVGGPFEMTMGEPVLLRLIGHRVIHRTFTPAVAEAPR